MVNLLVISLALQCLEYSESTVSISHITYMFHSLATLSKNMLYNYYNITDLNAVTGVAADC